MLEKPDLSENKILTCLNTSFGIEAEVADFLPIGNDSSAWVYSIDTKASRYFLKVRKGTPPMAVLHVPHYLKNSGIHNIVAPLATETGRLYAVIDNYALILYDWIHGTSAWNIDLSDAQWQTWGDIMRQIHQTPIDETLASITPRETFVCKWEAIFKQVNSMIQSQTFDEPIQQQTAAYWQEQQSTIDRIYQQLVDMGRQLQEQSHEFVICHADIHRANIMLDQQGEIHIVDWDEVIIAPRERDLMFFADDGHASHEVNPFLRGYGDTTVKPLTLAYYRHEWVVQEFGDYGERVFLNDDLSQNEKQFSLKEFRRLFSPGDVVALADKSYKRLTT